MLFYPCRKQQFLALHDQDAKSTLFPDSVFVTQGQFLGNQVSTYVVRTYTLPVNDRAKLKLILLAHTRIMLNFGINVINTRYME